MHPHVQASLAVFEEVFDALERFLAPLDDDCLNWRPPAADTNTIAGLVHHTVGSTNSWLARAIGETIQRDRDAEFHGRGTAADLVRVVQSGRAEARRRLGLVGDRDLGESIPVRRLSTNRDMEVTRGWCIEHALIHAGEHWGQIQLTRQLYDARG